MQHLDKFFNYNSTISNHQNILSNPQIANKTHKNISSSEKIKDEELPIKEEEERNTIEEISKITVQLKERNLDEIKMYEKVQAEDYIALKKALRSIAEDKGFDLSQGTGLKAKKYAYFHCAFHESKKLVEENQKKNKLFKKNPNKEKRK